MSYLRLAKSLSIATLCILLAVALSSAVLAQSQGKPKGKGEATKPKPTELSKLRDQYVEATRQYKQSLQRLLAIYERNVPKSEQDHKKFESLYKAGLISKRELEASETAVAAAKDKVADVKQQLANADTQIANALLEADAESKLANVRIRRGALVRTTSYIRFAGGNPWALSDSWKVQKFFQDAFKRPLPIAVFGQGAIHDRWGLDHRNSMDISLHPDGAEGQALLNFLRLNGIPFLAFRTAIPGTATGAHIHIGRPSHRY